MVGSEALQGSLNGIPDGFRAEVLRDLLLAAASVAVVHEVVPDLGGDHHATAFRSREGLGDEFLAPSVAVGVGGVKEVDPFVGGETHEANGLLVGVGAPPSGGDGPESETDFTYLEIRSLQTAMLHS